MSVYHFQALTKEHAVEIGSWCYDGPYKMYSMDGSDEELVELMSGEYFAGLKSEQELVGFLCKGIAARVPGGYSAGIYTDSAILDIGLGLKPEVTNKGVGFEFMSSGLSFLYKRYQPSAFQLVVAAFNERAIKVYERIGFVKCGSFKNKSFDRELDFIVMRYVMVKEQAI